MGAALLMVGFVYLVAPARGYLGGDQAQFALIAAEGGYAHAPGYPIYSLILHLVGSLSSNPFLASSVLSGVFGIGAVVVLFLALRAWGVGASAALIAALLFGFAPEVVFVSSKAEVFALNNLLLAAILRACAPDLRAKNAFVYCGVLGVLAGLAISHHHTAVLLAPIGVWAAVSSAKLQQKWAALLAGVGGLAAGLTPYLYLPYVAEHRPETWHWGDPTSADGLLSIFLREDYGTLQMSVAPEESWGAFNHVVYLCTQASLDLYLIGVVAAVAGAIALWKDRRSDAIALCLAALLIGPVFVSLFDHEPVGFAVELVRKFHLGFELIAAFLSAFAVERYVTKTKLQLLVVALLLVAGPARSLEYVESQQTVAVDNYLEDLWSTIPGNGVLIATGDHVAMGSEYRLRTSDSEQLYINPHLLVHRWYRDRLRTPDLDGFVDGSKVDLTGVVRTLAASGRPVFISPNLGSAVKVPLQPDGLVVRTMAEPKHPWEVAQTLEKQYRGFKVIPDEETMNPWSPMIMRDYATNWIMVAQALEAAGQAREAVVAREYAAQYHKDEPSTDVEKAWK